MDSPACHPHSAPSGSRDGVTNQLIARLKPLISAGVLTPGARLPAERELAPAFGVSRSSLRHVGRTEEDEPDAGRLPPWNGQGGVCRGRPCLPQRHFRRRAQSGLY
ncbi:MAG: FadR family transcriptional regulator [Bryobacterales bacterium]|nr:FadR family transcriptional regulator [Bryobacterales bacterium]